MRRSRSPSQVFRNTDYQNILQNGCVHKAGKPCQGRQHGPGPDCSDPFRCHRPKLQLLPGTSGSLLDSTIPDHMQRPPACLPPAVFTCLVVHLSGLLGFLTFLLTPQALRSTPDISLMLKLSPVISSTVSGGPAALLTFRNGSSPSSH